MRQFHIFVFSLIFIIAFTKAKPFINLVDKMLEGDGVWYLAAAGTTGTRPPWESCVRVVITDTKRLANCTITYHNLTMTPNRIIFYLGKNEANITEIRSKGATHQYMIKTTNVVPGKGYLSTPPEFKDELDYEAAVQHPICWYKKAETPMEWRYVIMPVNKNTTVDAFFLIGVRARLQAPEYEIGIFTKGILPQDYVYTLMQETNRKNRIHFRDIWNTDKSPRYGYWFPPYVLPNMYMKCAIGYRLWDVTHKYNQKGEDDDEVKSIHTGIRAKLVQADIAAIKNHDATETIWVRQQ